MEVIIKDNMLVIIAEPETICFDLPKKVDNNLKHEIDSTIKDNGILAEYTAKTEICQLLSKYNHGNNIDEHRKQ